MDDGQAAWNSHLLEELERLIEDAARRGLSTDLTVISTALVSCGSQLGVCAAGIPPRVMSEYLILMAQATSDGFLSLPGIGYAEGDHHG